MDAIVLSDVTKTFGSHVAVDALSLRVPVGSLYGFIGPNGSGKTTTLRMIMHILLPDSGSIEVLGESDTRAAHDTVGYLPEERGPLQEDDRAAACSATTASSRGPGRPDLDAAIVDWLERLELIDWIDRKIDNLSKGMAQKVQFIAAVVARPQLVILDEPFSGLDPVNSEVLKDAVLTLKRSGTTVVFSTHDMGVAEAMCDRIFMIHKGKKVLDGTLDEIQAAYGEDVIRVRVDGGSSVLRTIDGVEWIKDLGNYQEVRWRRDPQVVAAGPASSGRRCSGSRSPGRPCTTSSCGSRPRSGR